MRTRNCAVRRLGEFRISTTGRLNRGQSLVEFALMLPVMLLIVVGGLDFGRVFLGWVSLNNTARVAANYAGSNALLVSSGNSSALASYNTMVQDDAAATNCTPPNPIPAPVYSPNANIGSTARVSLSCTFNIITPILSQVLGGSVQVSASATFPVRTGIVANVPGGGSAGPVAAFTLSPDVGEAPLQVSFNNTTGPASSWTWDFDNGLTSSDEDPSPVTYVTAGTFNVTLTASDGLSTTTAVRTVTVTLPPGPVAAFSASPSTGTAPLTVSFVDTTAGAVTAWAWDFDNGQVSTLESPPNQTYSAGTYDVSLIVTDDLGQVSAPTTLTIQVTAPIPTCTVPDFVGDGIKSNKAIDEWTKAGFVATNLVFNPSRPPEFDIKSQSATPAAGTQAPCDTTTVTVSK